MDFTRRTLIIPDAIRPLLTASEIALFEDIGLPFINLKNAFPLRDNLTLMGEDFIAFGDYVADFCKGIHLPSHTVVSASKRIDYSCFCNSSLRLYVRSLELFYLGLPYRAYDEDEALEELDLQGRQLLEGIRAFDPPAAEDGAFWSELYWDIGNSDWDLVGDGI